ncbi:MAG: choice-of-anchor D domain-containing protein [Terriglobales bacterium]
MAHTSGDTDICLGWLADEVVMARSLCSQESGLLPVMMSYARSILALEIWLLATAAPAWAQQPSRQLAPPERPVHMVRRMVNPVELQPPGSLPQPPAAHLNYYGGPVISNLQVVVIFWGPDVYAPVTEGIAGFFQNITASAYFDLLSEYDTNVTAIDGSAGTNQSIGRGTYGGSFTITPSVCNVTPCAVTDDQVQTELLSQLNAGQLPMPELDGQGNVNTMYMIYFPPGVTIQLEKDSSCVQFCAYHGTTTSEFNSKNLAYGVMPDFSPPAGCREGCGSGTDFENITAVSSHEIAETVTDVDAGLTSLNAPPLAWYDPVFGTGEIGDICNHEDSKISTPGGTFSVQLLWSNQMSACLTIGAHPAFQLTAPSSADPGASVNFSVVVENPSGSSTDTSFAGTVHFTSSDTRAILPADSTFAPGDQGIQGFNATLGTSGSQTIIATDTINSAITGAATVTVSGTILTYAPTALSYGTQAVGTTSSMNKVTLTNQTGGTIAIASIAITGADAGDFANMTTTCGSTLALNNSCSVSMPFTPGGLGIRYATLAITDGAGNSQQQIALSGTGVVQVSLVPAAPTFATTVVGKKSPTKVIKVTNNLRTTLTFSTTPFSLTGSDPGDFSVSATTCRLTLAAHAHCTVSVAFSPAARGLRSAVLNVSDNANPGLQMADLSGTGK